MAQRITWQQIAAPDMSAAVRARESAAEMISKAFSGIGNSLGEIDERNVNQLNMVAQNRALAVQDTAEWERMMANGGLASLGIDPARANSTLMNYADGRRSDLLSEDATKVGIKNSELNYQKGTYDFDRTRVLDQRSDEAYQASLDRDALLRKVNEDVFQLGATETSKEALVARIENEARAQGWDAEKTKLYLDAARGQDDARWAVNPDVVENVELTPDFTMVREALSERKAARQIAVGSNETLRFYETAMTNFGEYKNHGDGLSQRFLAKVDPSASDEDKAVHAQKAGEVQDLYNSVKNMPEFKDMPPEMVALALETHLESNGWFLSDKQTKIDEDAAVGMLRKVKGGLDLGTLEKQRSQIDFSRREDEKYQRDYNNALQKMAQAVENQDEEGMARANAELAKLAKSVVPTQGPQRPPTTEKDTPTQAIAAPPPLPITERAPVGPAETALTFGPSVGQIAQNLDTFFPGSGYSDVMRGGPLMPPERAPTVAPPSVTPPSLVATQGNAQVLINQALDSSQSSDTSPLGALAEDMGLPDKVTESLSSIQRALDEGVNPNTGASLSNMDKALLRAEMERLLENLRGVVGEKGVEDLKALLKN